MTLANSLPVLLNELSVSQQPKQSFPSNNEPLFIFSGFGVKRSMKSIYHSECHDHEFGRSQQLAVRNHLSYKQQLNNNLSNKQQLPMMEWKKSCNYMVDDNSLIVTFPSISRKKIWLRNNTFQHSLFGQPGKCISNKWVTVQHKNVDFWQEFLALERK